MLELYKGTISSSADSQEDASRQGESTDNNAYQLLREKILDLHLRPGINLSIRDICELLNIGRTPVRDALIRLEQEDLVTLLPQKGTRVSKIDLDRVEQERFLRLAVEEEVMKLFMACHTPTDLLELQNNLMEQKAFAETKDGDIRKFLYMDDEFHKIFYRVTDRLFSFQTINNVGGHFRRIRLLSCREMQNVKEIVAQHEEIILALQTRDTKAMVYVLQKHLFKLDRDKKDLIKKYPSLFKRNINEDYVNIPWTDDFFETFQSFVEG
ncbi:GntR family transcriptional regulator [Lachnospiraceae bacterium 54-53]